MAVHVHLLDLKFLNVLNIDPSSTMLGQQGSPSKYWVNDRIEPGEIIFHLQNDSILTINMRKLSLNN